MDAISRAGDFDARKNYQANHLADTIKFLQRHEAEEYTFLYSDRNFETITQYLLQVEPGKRFYAYRWLFGWFAKLKGKQLPTRESMVEHLQDVMVDSRVKVEEVKKIIQSKEIFELPQTETIDINLTGNSPVDIRSLPSSPPDVPATPIEDKPTELVKFKTQIPDLPKLLAESLKLTLIVGVPGSGKGIFVSNALEAVKRYHPNTTIFYIDPKNDPKETAYFSGRVDKIFRKDLMTTIPDEAAEWVANCLAEYDCFDCGEGRKLLVFDELNLTLKTLGAVKVEKGVESPLTWFKRKLSGYASSGDSKGITLWGISQNAHCSGLGMDGGDRTMFIPVFIVDARNISASEGILKAQMIPSDKRLNSVEIQQLWALLGFSCKMYRHIHFV